MSRDMSVTEIQSQLNQLIGAVAEAKATLREKSEEIRADGRYSKEYKNVLLSEAVQCQCAGLKDIPGQIDALASELNRRIEAKNKAFDLTNPALAYACKLISLGVELPEEAEKQLFGSLSTETEFEYLRKAFEEAGMDRAAMGAAEMATTAHIPSIRSAGQAWFACDPRTIRETASDAGLRALSADVAAACETLTNDGL